MKNCFKCGKDKLIDDFYKHPQMTDGLLGKCKECTKSDVANNRDKNLDRIRAYDRKRGGRITLEYLKGYRESNPEKYRAHCAANNAVRDGKLHAPETCEGPGCNSTGPFHKHHEDYSKPLEVDWYCPACHHSGNHK
jgi:hypothetical protein